MIEGRTILLTGGSRGIGRDLASRLCGANRIVSLSRSGVGIDAPSVTNVACNLADTDAVTACADDLLRRFPEIDLLINNAAVLASKPVAMMPDADILSQVQVNLIAPMLLTKRVLKKMMSRKRGRIVNVISMSHRMNKPGDSVYAATKAGLETFGKIANAEAHPFGVTVNSIAVSAVETGMLEQIAAESPETIRNLIPHRRFADIDGIMSILEFFCRDDSDDVGGQTVFLGGV